MYLRGMKAELIGATRRSPWPVPTDSRVEGAQVLWSTSSRREHRSWNQSRDFFLEFLELSHETGDGLATAVGLYVQRWGPLQLCSAHGLPSRHGRLALGEPRLMPGVEVDPTTCEPSQSGDTSSEPVSRWRQLASHAVALLMLRSAIGEGREAIYEDLLSSALILPRGLYPAGTPSPQPVGKPLTQSQLRKAKGVVGSLTVIAPLTPEAVVGTAVRQWIQMSGVQPTFGWGESGPHLELEATNLVEGIALRLAEEVTNARPTVKCKYCGKWYKQTRRGTFFCGSADCGKDRIAENKRRQRVGLARKNSRSGQT